MNHGDHVYTVELVPERRVPLFRPGQFLHLALDDYDPAGFWPESRVFSIANSPNQRERLTISYSVRGRFTGRMENELEEGRFVWIKLPYGEFVVDDSKDAVIFAGGTGITAFTAFIGSLTPNFPRGIYLFYGARCVSLLIYSGMTDRVAARVPEFHVSYSVEEPFESLSNGEHCSWSGHASTGRLSVAAAWPLIQSPSQANYYIAGPPLMVESIRRDLRDRQVAPESIRVDAWE